MSHGIIIGVILTLLLISVSAWAFNIQPVMASGTICIRADGSIDPPTANIASVDNVTYTFTDNNYASIVVERGNIVIDGNGYKLQGSGSGNGLYWTGTHRTVFNITIKNTSIKGFNCGVFVAASLDSTISGNNITNNEDGVLFMGSENNVISGNKIANNKEGVRLEGFLGSGINNTVSENNITNNENVGVLIEGSSDNVISGNNIINHFNRGVILYGSDNNAISGNNITNCGTGIFVELSDNNVISENQIAYTPYGCGLSLSQFSDNNVVSGNNIINNGHGIFLGGGVGKGNTAFGNKIANNKEGVFFSGPSSDNRFYHNSFVDNAEQVFFFNTHNSCINIWDDGYPSGGNYWSDYVGVDLYRGPYQNETGSDSIGDTSYIIDEDNQDNYPLMEPWGPIEIVNATIDIDPGTLNLRSRGKWITCYIELPDGYNVSDIDLTSVMLNDTVPAYLKAHVIGDYDEDGIPDLTVKFDRAEVIDYIMANANMTKLLVGKFITATLTITGELHDGTPFQGNTAIRIILPKMDTEISFDLSPNPVAMRQAIALAGNLADQYGNKIANVPVEVYYSMDNGLTWTYTGTIRTDSYGWFSAKGKLTIVGIFLVAVVYRGSFKYNPSYHIETLTIKWSSS